MTDTEDADRATIGNLMNQFRQLFAEQRWDEWLDLWADDGVLEFPFAPPGRRSRYVGKADILAYMKPVAGRMQIDEVEYLRVHPMLDPRMVCMEMGLKGRVLTTGAALNQKYVSILETREGKLWRYREYWNPIVSMDANGGRDAWTAAFGSPDQQDAA